MSFGDDDDELDELEDYEDELEEERERERERAWKRERELEHARRKNNSGRNAESYSTNSSSEGCYIATAVYGSYDCPPVWTLRRFRDERLKKSWYGRLFIRIYYKISPTIVRLFGKTKWFNSFFKGILDHIVNRLEN